MGAFSKKINVKNLASGLRPSRRMPRDSGYLTECAGAVGKDGVLSVLDEISRIATDVITDGFPYPQIFVFTQHIVVCGLTKIYEWEGSSLVEKLTVTAGSTWRAVDYHHFIYMSNGVVAVERVASTHLWGIADQPTAHAMCDFNGQAIIGSLS